MGGNIFLAIACIAYLTKFFFTFQYMNVTWKSYEIAQNWNDTSEKILLILPLARARFWKKEKDNKSITMKSLKA